MRNYLEPLSIPDPYPCPKCGNQTLLDEDLDQCHICDHWDKLRAGWKSAATHYESITKWLEHQPRPEQFIPTGATYTNLMPHQQRSYTNAMDRWLSQHPKTINQPS